MKLFLLLSFVVSCVGSAYLGVRLVLAGRKSRKMPELAYGASLLFMSCAAVLRLVVNGILENAPEYFGWVVVSGCLRVGTVVALTWGIRVIFRSADDWAWAPMLSIWGLALFSLAVVIAYPGGIGEAGPIFHVGDLTSSLAAAWGAAESFSYYTKMRRRRDLGLADPIVTQQFRLWGIGFSCGTLAGLILIAGGFLTGAPVTEFPACLALVQLFVLAMTLVTWLAFYPPRWLQQQILGDTALVTPAPLGGA